jgi:25S rRNA (uracil2634-N3)-methyltransferase
MSKTKTKRAHRELKRDAQKKQHKYAKALSKSAAATTTAVTKLTQKATTRAKDGTTSKPPKAHVQPSQQQHEIPFGTYDNILLVGEGDFSFTRSLVEEHGCANVTGTSFDSEEEVRAKYILPPPLSLYSTTEHIN